MGKATVPGGRRRHLCRDDGRQCILRGPGHWQLWLWQTCGSPCPPASSLRSRGNWHWRPGRIGNFADQPIRAVVRVVGNSHRPGCLGTSVRAGRFARRPDGRYGSVDDARRCARRHARGCCRRTPLRRQYLGCDSGRIARPLLVDSAVWRPGFGICRRNNQRRRGTHRPICCALPRGSGFCPNGFRLTRSFAPQPPRFGLVFHHRRSGIGLRSDLVASHRAMDEHPQFCLRGRSGHLPGWNRSRQRLVCAPRGSNHRPVGEFGTTHRGGRAFRLGGNSFCRPLALVRPGQGSDLDVPSDAARILGHGRTIRGRGGLDCAGSHFSAGRGLPGGAAFDCRTGQFRSGYGESACAEYARRHCWHHAGGVRSRSQAWFGT